MKRSLLAYPLTLILLLFLGKVQAAGNEDTAYIRVVTERAGKIVARLDLPDSAKFYTVRTMVADQYRTLNTMSENKDTSVTKQHSVYLAKLATVLTPQQIDQVKDGMTYGVLEVTYKAYCEKYPGLTDMQKAYIMNCLTEAAEHAMDGGSSKEKHAWFGKYKGRINNYLSAQGYDQKKN
ncbi:DUF3826 domain-containing protein [Puia sp. P3]|uniref:DUF3826 domain-containing protein n=1 Tax=Puia sp. P3 TaxID=3423952 RepID=UPI003D670299